LKTDKTAGFECVQECPEMDLTALYTGRCLNYAKLSYEIGNSYQSVPAVLLGFIKKYPDNGSRSVIEKLLIDLYISSKTIKKHWPIR
jgi:hypothetical protein